ncbi:MAG TPA: PQQ-binding-like beta-propeller repeat protein [Bacteroidales bacterium]|nr:PQQ-binding-like beta-propeller repeat protein [Bacteroidales bacterium]
MRALPERFLKLLPIVLIFIGITTIGYWLLVNPTKDFTLSMPGKDHVVSRDSISEQVSIGALFEHFTDLSTSLKGSWTQFRGSNSDNIKHSEVKLITRFGGKKPPLLWSVELGEGHSGAAIYHGKAYVLDYDEVKKADQLRCFALETGQELWRRGYKVMIRRNHGMSRTVPAVTEKFILTMGPRGHVMCLERETGNFIWGMDLAKEFGSEIPLWYTGQCPLIVNDVAILATGGSALLIGVDCASGKILWKTPNPDAWKMSHSSVMPYTYKGRNMFVYTAVGGVIGVAADGPKVGTVLWKSAKWNKSVVAPSPVCTPNGRIFLTAGYGAGAMVLQLDESNGEYSVKEFTTYKPGDGLSSEQQTPIMSDGYLFGIMPKDAKMLRNQLVCANAEDPSKIVWSSGSESRFGLGPYLMVDDCIYLLNDDATLYIIRKSLKGYEELDHIQLFEGIDAWAPLAVADGYMLLRDSKKMVCIQLKL